MAITKITSIGYYTNEYTEDVSLYGTFGVNYEDSPTLETIVAWANGDYSSIEAEANVTLRSRSYTQRTGIGDLDHLIAPRRERPMGWDIGVATPKDISILWALLSDEDMIASVWDMHGQSVGMAAEYLRRHASVARVMNDGVSSITPVEPLMVGIEHSLNRKLEPHLHSHLLVFRDGYDPEAKRLRSLHSPWMYRHYQVALALHRASMRYRIAEAFPNLRYERNARGEIVIANMPTSVRERFLGRRRDIEQWVRDHALAPQLLDELKAQQPTLYHQIMQRAALETRSHKPEPSFTGALLRDHWHRVIGRARSRALEDIFTPDVPRLDPLTDIETLFEQVAARLATRSSTWTREDVLIAIAESATYGIASLTQVEELADQYLASSTITPLLLTHDGEVVSDQVRCVIPDELLEASDVDGTLSRLRDRYTSTVIVEQERAFVKWATSATSRDTTISSFTVMMHLNRYPTLSDEQREAIMTITSSRASVPIVRGGPGSGKTYMLRVATEIWEDANIDVIGVAFTGKAAAGLLGSIPNAMTIDRFLLSEKPDRPYVVLCDEASQVSTALLARLQETIEASNGRLVLIGDHRQLPSVQAGGVFTHLWQRREQMSLAYTEMRGNQRQQADYMREIVSCLEQNRVKQALEIIKEHDGIIANDDEDLVLRKMATDYYEARLRDEQVVMLALRNEDVARLNANARALLVAARNAGKASPIGKILISEIPASTLQPFVGQREYREQERIMLLHNDTIRVNDARYSVRKGFTGTVLDKTEHGLRVQLDGNGSVVELPMHYLREHTDYAYARTIYRSQGETIGSRNAHGTVMVFRPDTLTPEDAWVAATRATHELKMYIALSVRKRDAWAPYTNAFAPLGVPKLNDTQVLDFDNKQAVAPDTKRSGDGGLAVVAPPVVEGTVEYSTLYENLDEAIARMAHNWDMDRSLNNGERAVARLSVNEVQARLDDALELASTLNLDELAISQQVYGELRAFSQSDHEVTLDQSLGQEWNDIAMSLASLIADPVSIDPEHELARLHLLAFVLAPSDEVDRDNLMPIIATLTEALHSVDDDKTADRNRVVLRLARMARDTPEQAGVVLDYLRSALIEELSTAFNTTPDLALQVLERRASIDLALELAPRLSDADLDLLTRSFGGDETRLASFRAAQERYHERIAEQSLAADAMSTREDEAVTDFDVQEPVGEIDVARSVPERPRVVPADTPSQPTPPVRVYDPADNAAQYTAEEVAAELAALTPVIEQGFAIIREAERNNTLAENEIDLGIMGIARVEDVLPGDPDYEEPGTLTRPFIPESPETTDEEWAEAFARVESYKAASAPTPGPEPTLTPTPEPEPAPEADFDPDFEPEPPEVGGDWGSVS